MTMYHYTVKTKGRVIPKKQTAIVGDRVKFTCISETVAKWSFENNLLFNAEISTYPGVDNTHVILDNVQLENAGTYSCVGKYDFNHFEESAVLDVKCKLLV